MNQATPESERLSMSTVLAFSAANLPLGALAIAVSVYLPPYFASHLGVSLAVVGGAWALVRLLDMGVDPVLGLMMDRTRSRWGRYRPWLAAGAPVLMLAVWALFEARSGIGQAYLVGWLLIYYLGSSILGLGHSAWGATLSTEYHERSRVFGVVAMVGVIGAVIVLLFPMLAGQFGRSEAQSVRDMGWFIFWLLPLTVGLTVLRTPEHVNLDHSSHHFALRDYLALLVKPDLLRLFLAQMCLNLGPGWMSALYVFFFTDSREFSPAVASALLLLYVIAGVAGAPLTARIARRFGKHRTLIASTTAYSLALSLLLATPRGNVLLVLPLMFWCGFMAAGFDLMIRAMLADVGDEVRLEKGKEQLSLIYALNSLAAKIASAFAIGLTFPLLDKLGYVAREGAVNTPEAIRALELAFVLGPVLFVMLGGVCVLGWRLTAERHAEIRRQLDARDGRVRAAYEGAPILDTLGEPSPVAIVVDGDRPRS